MWAHVGVAMQQHVLMVGSIVGLACVWHVCMRCVACMYAVCDLRVCGRNIEGVVCPHTHKLIMVVAAHICFIK